MIQVCWRARPSPLTPQGMVARGAASRALARRALADGSPWRGLVGDDLVLLLADPPLPWVDGAVYLAPRPDGPTLWYDTRIEPDLPVALVARAVARTVPGTAAWLHDPPALVPLADAERLDPAGLGAWLVERT